MKKIQGIFLTVCLLCMIGPFLGMSFAMTTKTTENKTLSSLPKPVEDGKANLHYLSDLGSFFNDHFAFRQQMVSANAAIYGKLFGASVTDEVLLGRDGWMYYTGTLNDYTAEHLMSPRGLFNLVHNIKLMQDYTEARGSRFLFTIAPNKNALYDQGMPYYYRKGTEENNYRRLEPMLTEAGIHYVNLYQAFENNEEVLYFKTDSHWTNRGAALVYQTLMEQVPVVPVDYFHTVPYEVKKDHLGDLTRMVYPLNSRLEENEIFQKEWQWEYMNDVKDNMDNWIQTFSPAGKNSLMMFRDSFGESLVPFFAEDFQTAYFTRIVPYRFENVERLKPDVVILERVERRLSGFIEEAPVLEPPQASVVAAGTLDTDTSLTVREEKEHYVVSGFLGQSCRQENGNIYLTVAEKGKAPITYETFYISGQEQEGVDDYGFMAYLKKESILSDEVSFQVQAEVNGQLCTVAEKTVSLKTSH